MCAPGCSPPRNRTPSNRPWLAVAGPGEVGTADAGHARLVVAGPARPEATRRAVLALAGPPRLQGQLSIMHSSFGRVAGCVLRSAPAAGPSQRGRQHVTERSDASLAIHDSQTRSYV